MSIVLARRLPMFFVLEHTTFTGAFSHEAFRCLYRHGSEVPRLRDSFLRVH
jgi:hypothetical protein